MASPLLAYKQGGYMEWQKLAGEMVITCECGKIATLQLGYVRKFRYCNRLYDFLYKHLGPAIYCKMVDKDK